MLRLFRVRCQLAWICCSISISAFLLLATAPAGAAAPATKSKSSASSAPVDPNRRTIRLENRTYTPLLFRTRDSAGSDWSEMKKILPGGWLKYANRDSISIEVSATEGKKQQFTVSGGKTYQYMRPAPKALPKFIVDSEDRARGLWKRPMPPQPEEFVITGPVSYSPASGMFKPLDNFIDRCKDQGDDYRLSIKKLALDCWLAQQQGGKIPEQLRYLRGFTWFFGYLVDRERDDIVLLGVKDPTRPPIDLDCLTTAVMTIHYDQTPRCSLDEHPDPKYQQSVVGGVPWNTRWAEIMIEADYVMKKVSQGHLNPQLSGLRSWFDRRFEYIKTRSKIGITKSENRWWFNFDTHVPRSRSSRTGDLAVIYQNPVIVSTEKKLNGKYGSGKVDAISQTFATEFTNNMVVLGKNYPSVAELTAIFRLYDLFFHLKNVAAAEAPAVKYWIDIYERPYAGPPKTMPTLSRHKTASWSDSNTRYTLESTAKGGVLMRLGISDDSLQKSADDDEAIRARIVGE